MTARRTACAPPSLTGAKYENASPPGRLHFHPRLMPLSSALAHNVRFGKPVVGYRPSLEAIMRTLALALVAAGTLAAFGESPARAADHRHATAATSGQQSGRHADAVLRFAVW